MINSSRKNVNQHEEKPKIYFETIKAALGIIISSLIILTLTILTYFGMYVQLSKLTMAAQTVTVGCEGPAAEMYPDMIGQYNILRDVYFNDRAVYQHTERKDRFIINNGSNSCVIIIITFVSTFR